MSFKLKYFLLSFPSLLPAISLAQINYYPNSTTQPAAIGNISYILQAASGWLGTIATLLIGLAVVIFFWGIIRYVISGSDEEKRKQARGLVIYGIIGLFVMVGIWGIVYLLASVLGIQIGGGVSLPGIPCVLGSSGCVPTP